MGVRWMVYPPVRRVNVDTRVLFRWGTQEVREW